MRNGEMRSDIQIFFFFYGSVLTISSASFKNSIHINFVHL